jgi:hypothetical protein
MGSLLGLRTARRRAGASASFGLVRQLVERDLKDGSDEDQAPPAPMGVLRIGAETTVCRVEHVPAVGDLIHGTVTAIVEKVRIARNGRVSIVASPVTAPDA